MAAGGCPGELWDSTFSFWGRLGQAWRLPNSAAQGWGGWIPTAARQLAGFIADFGLILFCIILFYFPCSFLQVHPICCHVQRLAPRPPVRDEVAVGSPAPPGHDAPTGRMPPTWPLTTSCPLNPFNPPNQPSPHLELTLRLKTRSQLVAQDPIAARGGSLKAAVAPFPPPAGHIWGFSPRQRGGRFPDRPGTPSAGGAGGETKDRAAAVLVVVWRPPAPLRSAPVPAAAAALTLLFTSTALHSR